MKNASDIINAIKIIGPNAPKETIDLIKRLKPPKFGPEECCKEAASGKMPSFGGAIALFCNLKGVSPIWEACKIQHGKDTEEDQSCSKCCDKMFGYDNNRTRCLRACGELV